MQINAKGCFDFFKRPEGIPICVEMLHLAPRDNIPRFGGWERSATSPWPPLMSQVGLGWKR